MKWMMRMEELKEKVYCRSCNRRTNHNVLFQHPVKLEVVALDIIYINYYCIISCAGCDYVSYITIISNNKGEREVIVYPEEPKVERVHYQKIWSIINSDVPKNIKDLYIQIIESYNQNFDILCGIGLRTLIESICLELKITKGFKYDETGNPITKDGKKESLEGKIFGLYEKKFITWYHALILQRIREIGNAATHELVKPTSDELYSAIDIVEKLIENIYELKNHDLLMN